MSDIRNQCFKTHHCQPHGICPGILAECGRSILIVIIAIGGTLAGIADGAFAQTEQDSAEEHAEHLDALREKAGKGDIDSQFVLGIRLALDARSLDLAEAAQWFRAAAVRGHEGAQAMLGAMYLDGEGMPKDLVQAAHWLGMAAEQGHVYAQLELAKLHSSGDGAVQDLTKAAHWFRQAAEQGNAEAQFHLSYIYLGGLGVPEASAVESMKWVLKAAEQDYEPALYTAGANYSAGSGVVQDDAKAYYWLSRSAARGHEIARQKVAELESRMTAEKLALAELELGNWQYDRNHVEAARWFLKSAERGNADGQNNAGVMYEHGRGVAQNYAEAARWYRQAAEQGLSVAQYNLGLLYEDGLGVTRDYSEAARWYRRAAEQQNTAAQFNLALLYAKGFVTTRPDNPAPDYAEAARWYREAAEKDHAKAQYNLSLLYEQGNGVPKDHKLANMWLRRAANLGEEAAIDLELGRLNKIVQDNITKLRDEIKSLDEQIALIESQPSAQAGVSPSVPAPAAAEAATTPRPLPSNVSPELAEDFAQYETALLTGFGSTAMIRRLAPTRLPVWQSAADRGDPFGLLLAARSLDLGVGGSEDPKQALELCRRSAELGFPHGQNLLGTMYYLGRGAAASLERALEWWRKAADQGLAQAQVNLARTYYSGADGLAQDYRLALEWAGKAAVQGHSEGQNLAGTILYNGADVPQDTQEGVKWFRRAALKGFPYAQNNLGRAYAAGQGVDRDLAKAEYWLRLAANQGIESATRELRRLQRNTPTAADVLAALQERQSVANQILATSEGMRTNYDKDNLLSLGGALIGEFMRDTRVELQNFKLHRVGRAEDGTWIAEWSARLHFSGVIGEAPTPNPLNLATALSELTVNRSRLLQREDGSWRVVQ